MHRERFWRSGLVRSWIFGVFFVAAYGTACSDHVQSCEFFLFSRERRRLWHRVACWAIALGRRRALCFSKPLLDRLWWRKHQRKEGALENVGVHGVCDGWNYRKQIVWSESVDGVSERDLESSMSAKNDTDLTGFRGQTVERVGLWAGGSSFQETEII